MRLVHIGLFLCLINHHVLANEDAKAREALSGNWKGFAVEGRGDRPDHGPVKLDLTISAKTIRGVEIKDGERIDHGEGEYTLGLKSDPKHLDATRTNERGRVDAWVGIYKVEGDKLYWCVARKTRPTTFETVKGQFLLILKRDKAGQ
jgi:uncharacterized protein (TIGR03067 family)